MIAEALARTRLRRIGITDERMDRMTSRQIGAELMAMEVLAEQAADRQREAAWLARASQGAFNQTVVGNADEEAWDA